MTYDEFLAWADEDTRAEWVSGEVVRTMPGNLIHQLVEELFLIIIGMYVRQNQLGLAIHEFSMKLRDSGRVPDILFTRTPPASNLATHIVGPADLAVEIVSPESVERDLSDKPIEYAEGGVGEYWIADLITGVPHFLQRDPVGNLIEVFPNAEGVYQSKVLTGLRFPARWLVEPPKPEWALEQLGLAVTGRRFNAEVARADSEQARADAEQARADAERARAETQRLRAERLAERLRALNIDPDRD